MAGRRSPVVWARTPLQRLADPLPATRLVVYCPHQEGPRRVRQFGYDAGQLAVKVVRSVLLVMRPVPGDRHDRAVSPVNRTVTFPS